MRISNLKQRREELGLTQTDLAVRIGVEKQTIYRYEKGLIDPTSSVVAELARALDVTADWLLGLVEDMHSHLTEDALSDDERKLLEAVRSGALSEAVKTAADIAERNQKSDVSGVKPTSNSQPL